MKNEDLTDRVALVTGSSCNIGGAISVALASRGANVIVHVATDTSAGTETAGGPPFRSTPPRGGRLPRI